MKRILVLNGPNLNLLGLREPGVYGSESYDTICARIRQTADSLGLQADCAQSNSEGGLIDRLHAAMGVYDCGCPAAGGGGPSVQYPRT